MAPPVLSVVIPTYNRRDLLPAAVDSALVWLDRIGGEGEILIVDDGSTDGTQAMVAARYAGELARGRIRFHQRERNGGAAAAKNSGAALAKGDWIVFLDSDDALIPEAALDVVAALAAAADAPVVFFRCIDMASGALIGEPLGGTVTLTLETHAYRWRYGECLPAVRPAAARLYPYVEDMPGYEAISYFRMERELGAIVLTPIVARLYRTEGADRVSAASRLNRSIRNRKYAKIMMGEFKRDLSLKVRGRYFITYLRAQMDYCIARGSAMFGAAR